MGHNGDLGVPVTLNTDLTKYHAGLVVGTKGKVAADSGKWARGSDSFVSVDFGPSIGTFDILRHSLTWPSASKPAGPSR